MPDLGAQDRVIFERNPLKLVLAEIRFPRVFELESSAGVANIQSALRAEYPLTTSDTDDRPTGRSGRYASRVPASGWRFFDLDENWQVVIVPDGLSLECRAYTRYEEFRARLERLILVAKDVLPISARTRLGLRYVDEISHPDAASVTDWQRFLRADLIGIAAGSVVGGSVESTAQQINLTLPEGKMAIRHGFRRETNQASVYFIDLDAYDDRAALFDTSEALTLFDTFKRWSWTFFRSSISDELVSYLRPRPIQ